MESDLSTSFYGLLSVSGEDANKFLQGQLTCDVNEVSQLQTRLGAHCNPQGRIISLFRLCWFQNQFILLMPPALIPIAINALKKYAVFFKVKLEDVSSLYKQLNYQGNLTTIFREFSIENAGVVDDLLIIKLPGTHRYTILGAAKNLDALLGKDNDPIPKNVWKLQDINEGVPAIYPETTGKFLPHEINLPLLNGVSFKKGCYTGQEIVARMEYRGKLKNKMFHAKVVSSEPPCLGAPLYEPKGAQGTIVDYCQKDHNNYELLVIAPIIPNSDLSLDPENTLLLQFFNR